MNELGNTPADKNYKPSGINRAEEVARGYILISASPFPNIETAAVIYGYMIAEKDLALTWEDAQLLHIITEKYMRELDNRIEAYPSSSQELFEEVLRRFNEHKK